MKRQRLLIVSGLVVLSAVGVAVWWNGPATGTQKTSDTTVVLGSDDAQTTVTTQFMSFIAPGSLRLKSSNEALSKPIAGQYLLANKNTAHSDQIGVTVGLLENNSLSDITAVQYRLRNTVLYEQFTPSFAPGGSVAFQGISSFEKSIFWSNGQYYAAVVVSGTSDRSTALDTALHMVVSSWRWTE